MLQALVNVVRVIPIQLNLVRWRQSVMKHFISVPQEREKNRRERKGGGGGGEEQTSMKNNETNTLAPLWTIVIKTYYD